MTLTSEELQQTITKGQLVEIIGIISADLAARSGAWDGKAPEWFPQPPEWLELLERALEVSTPPAGKAALDSLEFTAIWEAIKGWDLERTPGEGYSGATGTDVRAIQNSLARFRGTEEIAEPTEEEIDDHLFDEIRFLSGPAPTNNDSIDPEAVDKDCGC
jgi:hypothetical protein